MQHQEVEPPEALRDIIEGFWHISKDFGEQQSDFELVPDGCAEIISQTASDRLLGQAGGAMRAAGGTLPVSQVAAAAHATVRMLERKFGQAAGAIR